MPQLEYEYFIPQIVWLLITFGVMYVIMARVALPRISDVVSNRNQRIDSDLSDADQLKKEAEAAHQDYETALAHAKSEAHRIAQDMRDRLANETARLKADLDARLAEQTATAEASISSAKAEALGNVRGLAGDAASSVIERLLGDKPSPEKVSAIVDAVMKDREARETA
jgi:F-type H+-transporting ATPase subunit b